MKQLQKTLKLTLLSALYLSLNLSGTVAAAGNCPNFINDQVITPIVDNSDPQLTINAVYDYVQRNRVSNLRDLLSVFPDHFNTNFALIKATGGVGKSSL